MSESIQVHHDGPFAVLTLARPERHNALDAAAIAELTQHFRTLAEDASTRVVVLTGSGSSFCAGGDLAEMQASQRWSQQQHAELSAALSALFDTAWSFPKPLLARVNGVAAGIGAALVACCDLGIATLNARFSLPEARLGLVPGVLAQVLVPKIGLSHARALFISGEQITTERAFEIGLIHAITSAEDLDATVSTLARRMRNSAPGAVAAAKQMIDLAWEQERTAARQYMNDAMSAARVSTEGQEGLAAFLEKRPPTWAK